MSSNTTYAALDDLKGRVNISTHDGTSDTMLQDYLNTAGWMVDALTRGYRVGYEAFSESPSETRLFDDFGKLSVGIDDLLTISAITRGGYDLISDYYLLYPYNTTPKTEIRLRWDAPLYNSAGQLWYGPANLGTGRAQIAVTGTWGYCTQENRPAGVKELALQIAEMLYMELGLSTSDLMAAIRNPMTEAQKRILGLAELLQRDKEGTIAFA